MSSTSTPKPKIVLHRGWATPGYVWSPFVTKLEFRLRTSQVPYTCDSGGPTTGPRGKIPYISYTPPSSTTTSFLADSTLILKTLTAQNLLPDVNSHLSKKAQGIDLALRALLEDRLYFYHTHERWIKNYHTMRDHTLHAIPYHLRLIIGLLAYRGNVRKLYDQGTGRFSHAEVRAFVEEVWVGLNGMLEESRRLAQGRGKGGRECFWVLGGEELTEADATLFGFVSSVLVAKAGPESTALLKGKFPVVVDYAERIHARWFPDYEIWE